MTNAVENSVLESSESAISSVASNAHTGSLPLTLQAAFAKQKTLPPMMQLYLEFKAQYPDAILFFQVGDFFELFFDDAVEVSRALNLTLTSRDKNSPNPIPMCGFPLSVIDSYVDRLIPLGFSVAIVSQAGSGQGVDRKLERFVTPGMRLFTTVTSEKSEGLIAAVVPNELGQSAALVIIDPQAGVLRVSDSIALALIAQHLVQSSVSEVVLPKSIAGTSIDRRTRWVRDIESRLGTKLVKFRSYDQGAAQRSFTHGSVDSGVKAIQEGCSTAFHALSPTAKQATRQLLSYLDEVTLGNQVPIREVTSLHAVDEVEIDAATRRNLELVQNARDGSETGSLFNFLDHTKTPGGGRLLRSWLLRPLSSVSKIKDRTEVVKTLIPSAQRIRALLNSISDLERLAARVELRIATPRDVAAIRDVLQLVPLIAEELNGLESSSSFFKEIVTALAVPEELLQLLKNGLVTSPPHTLHDGGVIEDGFDAELDRIRGLRRTAESWRADFEQRERNATGIHSLKVKSNNVIGYFIEITSTHVSKVPQHYLRRQSTANADRFTVVELKEHEQEIVSAIDKQIRREIELFSQIRERVREYVATVRTVAWSISVVDVLSNFAFVADRDGFVEATLSENDSDLLIEDGRHPVIARRLGGSFVPNTTHFQSSRHSCLLLTGPNMGGKSTYLRQTAIITILAQIGCFVPARSATIGVVDKIFARLGASDDLHEGDSTFMVEMREAAHILSKATPRSLVLIDELGRGTATSDGLALAQAIVEELVQRVSCRTLFATHYHELTHLAERECKVGNLSVGSVDDGETVIFTHKIQSGPAPRSYGVEVAKLSGLPERVIERAQVLLKESDHSVPQGHDRHVQPILPLYSRSSVKTPPQPTPQVDPTLLLLKEKLLQVDIEGTSPRLALDILYELCRTAFHSVPTVKK